MVPLEVLVAEDDQDDLELRLHVLNDMRIKSSIRVARDGREVLDCVLGGSSNANMLRLVLLNLKLPKVDGLQVLRRIKEDPQTKGIPVVILTSSKEETDRAAAYQWEQTATSKGRWISTNVRTLSEKPFIIG